MIDQANRLRDMVKTKSEFDEPIIPTISSRVIAVTSGKGGVGKSNFAVNLAICFRKQNKRVVIIDADFGLANIEVLFGVIPKHNLSHVFNGEKTISEIVSDGPLGIKFISGGSGLRELANMNTKQLSFIIENFSYLDSISDIILIDTGAGISDTVISFIKASNETIIITTPEPTSITDAYAIIKSTKDANTDNTDFKIVVNRVDDFKEGKEIFDKLSRVSEKFLSVKLKDLGSVPYDNYLVKAVKRQEPVSICFPNSDFAKSIDTICLKLLDIEIKKGSSDGIKSFMKRLVKILNK